MKPKQESLALPAHDQRGKNNIVGDLTAPNGLGAVKEFLRLKKISPCGPCIKSKYTRPLYFKRKIIAK